VPFHSIFQHKNENKDIQKEINIQVKENHIAQHKISYQNMKYSTTENTLTTYFTHLYPSSWWESEVYV
jgi:hypothetical protein